MAALSGFELTISSDDTAVAMGTIDGVSVAGGTVDAAADADGDFLIVWTGAAYDHVTTVAAGSTVLGTATVASNLVTAVAYTGRGDGAPASA